MTVFKDKIEPTTFLRDLLLSKYKDVHTDVNLASRKFYQDWKVAPMTYLRPTAQQEKKPLILSNVRL